MPLGPGLGRFAGWAAATTVSVLTAWAALQPVLNTAVPDRVQLLTGAELRAQGPSAAPEITPEAIVETPAATSGPDTTSDPGPDESASTTPAADPDAPGPDQSSPTEPPDEDPDDAPPAPPSEPVVVDDWTAIDHGDGSTSYVQTFETDGGTATIEVEPGQTTLISATPNDPYSVDVYHEDPERVVVKFFLGNRMWVIDAMWWEERPYAQVSEVS